MPRFQRKLIALLFLSFVLMVNLLPGTSPLPSPACFARSLRNKEPSTIFQTKVTVTGKNDIGRVTNVFYCNFLERNMWKRNKSNFVIHLSNNYRKNCTEMQKSSQFWKNSKFVKDLLYSELDQMSQRDDRRTAFFRNSWQNRLHIFFIIHLGFYSSEIYFRMN